MKYCSCKDLKWAVEHNYIWVEEYFGADEYFYAIGNEGSDIAYKQNGLEISHCPFCGEVLCLHPKTVALNEEGNAGIYCSDCGEKLSDEC